MWLSTWTSVCWYLVLKERRELSWNQSMIKAGWCSCLSNLYMRVTLTIANLLQGREILLLLGETKYHVISLPKWGMKVKWEFSQLCSQLCTLVKSPWRLLEAGKSNRVHIKNQINNVFTGELWWSQLHLHSVNVPKALVWQVIYIFMYFCPFLKAYFNNTAGYKSMTTE